LREEGQGMIGKVNIETTVLLLCEIGLDITLGKSLGDGFEPHSYDSNES
jgi:hypothetical protein